MISAGELEVKFTALVADFVGPVTQATSKVKELGDAAKTAAADTKKIGDATSESSDKAVSNAGRVKDAFKSISDTIGSGLLDHLRKLAEMSSDAHESLDIAANSAHNLGHAFDAQGMERYMDTLARSAKGGGFAIDEMRAAVQRFAAAGATEPQAKRLLSTAVGMATEKHEALGDAAGNLVSAANGNVDALAPYGAKTKDKSGKPVSFGDAAGQVEKAVGGDAEKRADGLAGAYGRLSTAVSDLANGPFGKALEQIFTAVANAATRLVDWIAKIPGPVLAIGAGVATAIGVLGAFGGIIGTVVSAVMGMGGAIMPVIHGIGAVFGWLAEALVAAATPEIATIAAIVAAIILIGVAIFEVATHWNDMPKIMKGALDWAGNAIKTFVEFVKTQFSGLSEIIGGVWKIMHGDMSGAADIEQGIEKLKKSWGGVGSAIKEHVVSGVGTLVNAVKSKYEEISHGVKSWFGNITAPTIGAGPKDPTASLGGFGSGAAAGAAAAAPRAAAAGAAATPRTSPAKRPGTKRAKPPVHVDVAIKLPPRLETKLTDLPSITVPPITVSTSDLEIKPPPPPPPPPPTAIENLLNGLVTKLNIPGLQAKKDPVTGAAAGFSMNWQAFVLEAASKTKSFADVMKVVNEIMGVFVQILDAARPIIDLLLKVVGFLVNGFIDLWNTIARILRIFGIHITMLEKINTNFDQLNKNTVPLISITHDIPTMNELASGKIGPLSPTPIDSNTVAGINGPTVDAIKSPDMGGGILGKLAEILVGILALKTIMRWFGGGGGGGILGTVTQIAGNFGLKFGAGTNGTALLGNIGAVAGGALLGGLVGSSVYGGGSHTTWGAVGGAAGVLGAGALSAGLSVALGGAGGLGGGLSFLLGAGPGGWAALAGAALLGGLAGGAFGHKDNPVAMPDKYATQDYGQAQGDYLGYSGDINGSKFYESDQIKQSLGGKSEADFIGGWISQHGDQAGSVLSPDELKAFTGDNGIKSLHDGFLTLGNGTRMFWSDLFNNARDAITRIGKTFQTALDPNAIGNIGDKAQAITQGVADAGNELSGQVRDATCPGSLGTEISRQLAQLMQQPPGGGGPGGMPITINQNITHSGDINGADDVDDMASWHATAAERAIRNRTYLINRAWSPT